MEKRRGIIVCLVLIGACQAGISQFEENTNAYRKEGLKSFLPTGSDPEDLIKDPNKMDSEALIKVRTVDNKGKPIRYCRVVFVNRDEKVTRGFHETATDKDGYAYCDAISGAFSVSAHLYEFMPRTKAYRSQHKKIGKLYNAEDNKFVRVRWDPFPAGSGRVEGQVLDQYGKPLTKYSLTINHLQGVREDWSASYSTYQRIEVDDPQGHFQLGELAPRTYSYMVRAQDYPAYVWDFSMGRFTIPEVPHSIVRHNIEVEAKELLYGRAFYRDGSPLNKGHYTLWFKKHPPEEMSRDQGRYFALRIDPNGSFRVALSQKERKEILQCTGGYVDIEDRSGKIGKVHIERLAKEPEKAPALFFPRGEPRDSLVGVALPKLPEVRIDFRRQRAKGRMMLICFFDMNQRPSRHCIQQLAKQAAGLRQRGVTVAAIQASNVDEDTLNGWVKKSNIPFPVGMIREEVEQTCFNWGVRSLPWLILTDRNHAVTAEGFPLAELGDKLSSNSKD